MTIKHCNKLILSIALITVLIISISVFAYADPLAGAIAGGMHAMGATIGSTGATVGTYNQFISGNNSDPLGDLDPLGDYYVYYQKDSRVDTSTGIHYDSVWYSHDFARYLQDEGIAFLTDHSVLPNTQGTLASGYGYIGVNDQIPIYELSGQNYRSVLYNVTDGSYSLGDCSITVADNGSTSNYEKFTVGISSPYDETRTKNFQKYLYEYGRELGAVFFYTAPSNTGSLEVGIKSSDTTISTNSSQYCYSNGIPVTNEPFTFNYVAGAIDLTPIGSNYGLKVEVPSGYIPSSVTTGTYSVGVGSTVIYNISSGINTAGVNNDITAEFEEQTIPPTPTPTPTPTPFPTDALGLIPYDTFMGDFQSTVDQQTEDINDTIGLGVGVIEGALDTIGQSITAKLQQIKDIVDTIGQDIEDAADSVSDTIGLGVTSITEWLSDIYDEIIDGVADIVEAIEGIAEAVLEAIESFFETLFGDIQSAFGGWIADISDAFGIWHYVVEWLSCISTYFTFMRTIASGMPACFWSPVLALVAGTIVLGVYKRFLQ